MYRFNKEQLQDFAKAEVKFIFPCGISQVKAEFFPVQV